MRNAVEVLIRERRQLGGLKHVRGPIMPILWDW
jgi:hypothetical protein